MTMQTDSIVNEAELKRYLYSEMSDDERAETEEKLFLDDELFFEATNLENALVDDYVRNNLSGEELTRFERSLQLVPERQQKVANAVALQEYIVGERENEPVTITIAEQTVWQKLADLFTIRTPTFGYGMAGLLLMLTFLSVFLVLDNGRKTTELARLQGEQQNIQELEKQLADLNGREGELQKQIDGERETSGDLSEELQQEKTRREQIERELARLKKQNEIVPPTQRNPIIATFILFPTGGGKGGNDGEIKDLAVGRETKRIAVQLGLPDSVKSGERFSVNLNTRPIARNLAARAAGNGRKTIQLTILPADLQEGPNRLGVTNTAGSEVSRYIFNFQKK